MSLVSDLDLSQFHELLDGSRDGAFLLDSTYFVVYVNSAGARLCRAEVTAGISLPSLFPIADLSLCLVQFSPGEWIRWVPEWNQHLHFRLRPVLGNYFALWINEVTPTEISHDAGGVEKLEDEIRSSKERELFALQAAAMGVFSRNLITGEIYLSPRAMEQFGFSERKLLYFSDIQKIMHPDDIPRTLEGIQRAVADRSVYCNEYRVLWPDGSYHWLSVTGRATYDAEGQPLELHGVLLDITSRKNVEQALQRSTSALRSVLNASPLAIFNLDKAGLVQGWNYAAERMFGWAEAEVLGQSLPLTLPEALSQSAWIASGQTLSAIEGTAVRKSGEQLLISVSAAPLRDAVGIANGSVYVVDDITERRNLEQHLQHSQKMESLGVLAGGVAHDFNNLLTGILGNASLVLDDIAEDDPNRPLLNDVVRASERAATLTRQLLAYAGKGRFVAQPIQLSKLITEMHSLLESSLPKKVHFVRDLPLDLPWMEGDPSQLQQVIMNLVLNAAEAMEEKSSGGIFVSACVVQADGEYAREYLNGEAIVSGPYVLLEVHDTGSGMDEFVQARVFDPFFSTKFTGRGLGLSAVLGIVRSHGGALRVTSQKEQGTSFRILFPVTDIFSGATEKASERNQAILVTDVEVRDQLERLGYPVVAAKSSESALQILLGMRQSLALFLLEPEGQEALLGHINRLQAPIPVILITDLKDGEALRRFHRYRPAGFLRKPYTAESLDRKLLSVLYQQEMSDQSGTST